MEFGHSVIFTSMKLKIYKTVILPVILYGSIFRSKSIHRNNKVRLYKTLIKPVLSYRNETWTMTEKTENTLHDFERKVLRRIFGPMQGNGRWRIRRNKELYDIRPKHSGRYYDEKIKVGRPCNKNGGGKSAKKRVEW